MLKEIGHSDPDVTHPKWRLTPGQKEVHPYGWPIWNPLGYTKIDQPGWAGFSRTQADYSKTGNVKCITISSLQLSKYI